jgi:hypothetical protein
MCDHGLRGFRAGRRGEADVADGFAALLGNDERDSPQEIVALCRNEESLHGGSLWNRQGGATRLNPDRETSIRLLVKPGRGDGGFADVELLVEVQ